VRIEAETLCLTWSMQAGKIEWESEVIGATHRLTKTYRVTDRSAASAEWVVAHDAYHTALVSACGSPRLLRMRHQLYEQSERYRKLESTLVKERNPDDEHKRLASAVIERDIPLATRLLKAHLILTTENIVKAMSKRESKASRASVAGVSHNGRRRKSVGVPFRAVVSSR
jgi:DNA-binding GntR family transcriptional regulator